MINIIDINLTTSIIILNVSGLNTPTERDTSESMQKLLLPNVNGEKRSTRRPEANTSWVYQTRFTCLEARKQSELLVYIIERS